MRRPCNDCPWRRDAPRGFWDRQHFLDIWEGCQHDGTRRMGCHKMGKGADAVFLPCQGWLRVMGFDAIGVRLAVFSGEASVEEVQDTEGPALVGSFAEMMALEGFDVEALPVNRWLGRD